MRFVVPAGIGRPTGGNRYDLALTAALRAARVPVELVEVPGRWPVAGDRARLAGALRDDAGTVLVDGLVACGAPAEVAAAVSAGRAVHVLVHLPLRLDPSLDRAEATRRDALERAALHAATGVVATSAWAAADLRAHHCLDRVVVATPGTDPAPAAAGSSPPRLLHLAAVSPLKDQRTTVAALALLTDLSWTAHLTGDDTVDPGYTRAVHADLAAARLAGRVTVTGPLAGGDVDDALHAADLLLLPSRVETWGLVVTEALARGIPCVVCAGTGSVEALGVAPDGTLPGAVVPAGDPAALAAAVRDLLGAGRTVARNAAAARRSALPGWAATAEQVLSGLRTTPPPPEETTR